MKSGRIFFRNFNNLKKFIKRLELLKSNQAKQVLKQSHEFFFSKHLLATNLVISMSFSGIGDVIEQIFEIYNKEIDYWNKKRTLKLSTTGLTVGVVCHYWYMYLDKKFPHNTHKSIFKKIVLNQLIFSPLCIFVFFSTLTIINQSGKEKLLNDIIQKGRNIYIAEWIVWPPASLINFYFVPYRFRVLYDSIASLGFDIYNSYIVHREFKKSQLFSQKVHIESK